MRGAIPVIRAPDDRSVPPSPPRGDRRSLGGATVAVGSRRRRLAGSGADQRVFQRSIAPCGRFALPALQCPQPQLEEGLWLVVSSSPHTEMVPPVLSLRGK